MVIMCWVEYLEGKFEDVCRCLNPSSHIILESGCDNDYKSYRGSHITNAAGDELRNLHGQALPQRFFAATEYKMKLTKAEYKRGDILSSSEAEESS